MSAAVIREPAVAGRFYPANPSELDRLVTELLRSGGSPRLRDEPAGALAAVAPHAGYVYSGSIAGETYAGLTVPERVIVLCPNHTGRGERRSLWWGGAWRVGAALVPLDDELVEILAAHAERDRAAHLHEHAIEVELPFLLKRQPGLRLTALCLASLSFAECQRLAEAIAGAIDRVGGDVLVVASTDMSHYVSVERARELDGLALDRLLALDAEGLYGTVREHRISMCGYIPTTVALLVAGARGASRAELVRYGNSGDASGDYRRVVGYAGALIH